MHRLPPLMSRILALLLLAQWSLGFAQGLRPLARAADHAAALCRVSGDTPDLPGLAGHGACAFCTAPAELPPAPPCLQVSRIAYAAVFPLLPAAAPPPPPRRLAPPSRAPPLA